MHDIISEWVTVFKRKAFTLGLKTGLIFRQYSTLESKNLTYLCSYPKSGRTWLRFILANYLNTVFDIGLKIDFHSLFALLPNDGYDSQRGLRAYGYFDQDDIPIIVSTHANYSPEFTGCKIIFLIRGIYDVLVSNYFHQAQQLKDYQGNLSNFVRDEKVGLAHLIRYLNSWTENISQHPSLVLTYEDMQEDTLSVLKELPAFLGLPLEREALKQSIKNSSFKRMQNIERTQGIPGHRYNTHNPKARRVREGKVGGYSKYLNPSDVEYIKAKCEAELTSSSVQILSRHKVAPYKGS
jgi:alcohol sulfotransferase